MRRIGNSKKFIIFFLLISQVSNISAWPNFSFNWFRQIYHSARASFKHACQKPSKWTVAVAAGIVSLGAGCCGYLWFKRGKNGEEDLPAEVPDDVVEDVEVPAVGAGAAPEAAAAEYLAEVPDVSISADFNKTILGTMRGSLNSGSFDSIIKRITLTIAEKFVVNRMEELRTEIQDGGHKAIIQKLDLRDKPNFEIKIFTDIHGNLEELLGLIDTLLIENFLDPENPLKIKKENGYIFFLGDAVDRGNHGAQVLTILMQLYLNNPEQVVLIKGNHEKKMMNAQEAMSGGGFLEELRAKRLEDSEIETVQKIYDYLTSECKLIWKDNDGQTHSMLFCHGGPNLFFPTEFYASTEKYSILDCRSFCNRRDLDKNLSITENKCSLRLLLGEEQEGVPKRRLIRHSQTPSLLTDFGDDLHYDHARGALRLDKATVRDFLSTRHSEAFGVIRGHQHCEFRRDRKFQNGLYFSWEDLQPQEDSREINLKDLQERPFVLTIEGLCNEIGDQGIVQFSGTLATLESADDGELTLRTQMIAQQ